MKVYIQTAERAGPAVPGTRDSQRGGVDDDLHRGSAGAVVGGIRRVFDGGYSR